MKRIIAITIILAIAGLIAWRLAAVKKQLVKEAEPPRSLNDTVAVTTAPVTAASGDFKFSAVGNLASVREAKVLSRSQGVILHLNAELGQRVSQGQTIATIDNNLQQFSINTAQTNLSKAEADLTRYKALLDGGAVTEQRYLEVKTARDNALTALEQSRKQFGDATVVSPISGVIFTKDVEQGSFANVGTQIASVIDVNNLKVTVSVPESQIYYLHNNDSATITSTVFPDRAINGKISYIAPRGDASHNFTVEIHIRNNPDMTLRAGTFVSVSFSAKTNGKVAVYTIPRSALISGTQAGKLYVFTGGKAVVRQVLVSREVGDMVEVMQGLEPGEQVITTGQLNLSDGVPVKVIK
ncbi:MAG: efflux RND transporter periplasmic adaptor subunit [Bacteroidota bacterium]